MRLRFRSLGLVVLGAALMLPNPLDLGSSIADRDGLRSGERVHWLPSEVGRLVTSLLAEGTDVADAAELAQVVHSESRRLGVDPLYVLALMKVESGFRANAVSRRGAIGLLQVRPIAARSVARVEPAAHLGATRLDDPRTNVALGLRYLQHLEEQFGDRATVLAAYNMGPTRVRRQMAERKPVSRAYAQRVRAAYRALRSGPAGQRAPSQRADS
jgi:soluble lytic murein transglycosylase-like protein